MAKKKKQEPLGEQLKDVWALVLFFLAVFIGLTRYLPHTTGFVGYWFVDYFCVNLFGQTVNYLPVFMFAGSASFMLAKNKHLKGALPALCAGYWAFVVFFEMRVQGPPQHFFPIVPDGGGLIGQTSAFVLQKTVGVYGGYVVLLGTAMVSLVLAFQLSLRKSILGGVKLLGYFKPRSGQSLGRGVRRKAAATRWPERRRKLVQLLFFRTIRQAYNDRDFSGMRAHKKVSTQLPLGLRPSVAKKPVIPATKVLEKEPVPVLVANDQDYKLPPISLLSVATASRAPKKRRSELQERSAVLEAALESFNVVAKVVNITEGPSVTRYELKPGAGVKISKITGLSQDIALKMAATAVRIEAPIPGKALIGIEVPNAEVDMINLRTIIQKAKLTEQGGKLDCALGLTITGDPIVMSLDKMPHVLIAGATGSGKSVCLNSIILSILMRARPDEVKFLMIDPKKVELSLYNDIPHLLAPVVTNPQKAAATLKQWALVEMENRYELFSKVGAKTIVGYNEQMAKRTGPDAEKPLPYIVVVIDELADLMMVASQEVENTICRLAQMARATGIHLVIATQRPSVNVVTGLIKANIPSRVSFYVQSQIDSRTILDMAGAEKLMGKGDMLYMPAGTLKPARAQGVYVPEDELKRVITYVKTQAKPEYLDEIAEIEEQSPDDTDLKHPDDSEDELFQQAKDIVQNTQYASTSYLQRKLRIGYNRAARLMDELEEKNVISAYDGEKKSRSVL